MFDFGSVDVIVYNIEIVMSLMHLYNNQQPNTPKNDTPESRQSILHWSVIKKNNNLILKMSYVRLATASML